jgi:WD40 repeat protein
VPSDGVHADSQIWDADTGRLLTDLRGSHASRVFSVVGDKTRVISTGLDCKINIWDFAEGLDTSFLES